MPKKGKDDLFRLIRSLSKTEKAYFKKFAERHTIGDRNNYLRLFDAIDRQKVYDEKALLKTEKYIRQLPYAKNYLMGSVLKAMQAFYAEHTEGHRLRRLTDDAWFLYKKGLFDISAKTVERIKTLSYPSRVGSVYFEALYMEELILTTNSDLNHYERYINSALPEARELLDDLLLYNELVGYYLRIFLYHRKNMIADRSELKKLRKEIEEPLLALEKKAKTFRCRTRLLGSLAAYYYLEGNYALYCDYNKKLLAVYRSSVGFIRDNLISYMSTFYNYANGCVVLGRYAEALRCAREIRAIRSSQPDEERKIFITATSLEMLANGVSGNHREAARVFSDNQAVLYRYFQQGFLQRYLILCTLAASSNAYMGNFREALKLIAHIFAHPAVKKTVWLETIVSVLQVLFLSESGQDYGSFIRNLRRRLTAGGKTAEAIITDYLEQKQYANTRGKEKELQQHTLERLLAIKHDRSLINFTDHFDILSWMESRISGRNVLAILKEKG